MSCQRAKIAVFGAVQGVGFRPFVYRLATQLKLKGAVRNSSIGVAIEIEGERQLLDEFLSRLQAEKPPRALIRNVECTFEQPARCNGFEIQTSESNAPKLGLILPDIATCADCVRELFDRSDRRWRYPFINCTNCGPRFTIIHALPYDRQYTSMKHFQMCPECEREYQDPGNCRFHAQPNACSKCGPHLELWDPQGTVMASHEAALTLAARLIRAGRILALKGIGGFQLLVDARQHEAVVRLRRRKNRPDKPFATMFPSLDCARRCVVISDLEEQFLASPEAPIVLLKGKYGKQQIAADVAPGNPDLGVMLPYSPVHHLLLSELGFPIVATSGNLTDEPLCIDEFEALRRLGAIADFFLIHNRPVVRPVDDSVVRIVLGRELLIRRARGYAPLPIALSKPVPPILAVGAQLKNTVALSVGRELLISQHLGDLETEASYLTFQSMVTDLPRIYGTAPELVVCDLHPDYLSSQYAHQLQTRTVPVQHHYAHILSCMAENGLEPPVLGVCWDGVGYGPDGTIWGGEFLLITESDWERVAHFRQFRLVGGNAAVKQPRRCALGVLHEIFGSALFERTTDLNAESFLALTHFSQRELEVLRLMIANSKNAPLTSSVGRLFDAVASLTGIRQEVSFEGQAAMEMEFSVCQGTPNFYDFEISESLPYVINWEPMIRGILQDGRIGQPAGWIATKFHNTLVQAAVKVAQKFGEVQVVLSGGCFQNAYLTEQMVGRLRENGFGVWWHRRIPPNDGGISVGQIMAASRNGGNGGGEFKVAAGVSPAVKGVRPAARKKAVDFILAGDTGRSGYYPPGETPGSTAGETPAATA